MLEDVIVRQVRGRYAPLGKVLRRPGTTPHLERTQRVLFSSHIGQHAFHVAQNDVMGTEHGHDLIREKSRTVLVNTRTGAPPNPCELIAAHHVANAGNPDRSHSVPPCLRQIVPSISSERRSR